MQRNNIVLLVLGSLILAKTLWIVISPVTFKKFAEGFLKKIKKVNTLTGLLYIALGVILLVFVMLYQPLVNWLLVIFGFIIIYAGTWFFDYEKVEKRVTNMVINRSNIALRVMGTLGIIIAVLLIWISIFKPVT